MARYTGPVCKLCRREGEKLFLKGSRCSTAKCAFEKRSYVPGQHGLSRRSKLSEYGIQLREKQKVKRIYGLLEKQFHSYYVKATRQKGVTGDNLLKMLESRLDNVVYRLGFAPSRKAARQLILHRHFTVNGKPVNVPSYMVKANDVISVEVKSRKLGVIHESMRKMTDESLMSWLRLDKAKLEGEFLDKPGREDIPIEVQENLIVELYSK
ncbi:30S ribosomal protein S4 [Candidatus Saccharibacteria bacterium]|nr:30S ribosomal protein S4 [Candidatus Saccharibacteria bacterium]NIV04553.1 30S ribosomal protein S4 [Calditrichia bacterium]NIV73154.1 30S ribosomal protein S4 [Calditrichia bacterium]NIW00506.1 30S ribosomal protein S4 [Candidatus Saccharibacteria bacterium]NIW80848.1 30S ribosomal protein S4 [Calditrichia bacterium]